jgi:sulfite exporter TauE/SafE
MAALWMSDLWAAVAGLVWVLAQQSGPEGVMFGLAGAVLLAAGLCCAAAWHGLSRRIYWRKLVEASSAEAERNAAE